MGLHRGSCCRLDSEIPMSEFSASIGIISTFGPFGLGFEVLGMAALVGLSIGWLKRYLLS